MVNMLWLGTCRQYVAHYDSRRRHYLVDRSCGSTKWIPQKKGQYEDALVLYSVVVLSYSRTLHHTAIFREKTSLCKG